MADEFLNYGQLAIKAADQALATPASSTGPQATSVEKGFFGKKRCLTSTDITISSGMVVHSGQLGIDGVVEAAPEVIVRRLADGQTAANNMALSFQASSMGQAHWVQFLGPSVSAFTGGGFERLVGRLTFGGIEVCGTRSRRISVETTLSPGDTPYFLDGPIGSPFANLPCTTFCQKFASGESKMTFFDRPIFEFPAVQAALKPFSAEFNKVNGVFPDALILTAEFYSYLVLDKTAVYLIHWQAEHEVLVTEFGGIKMGDAQYRQSVLDADCGPVVGLAADHHMILQTVFPNANIR